MISSNLFFRGHQSDQVIGAYVGQVGVEPNGNDPGQAATFIISSLVSVSSNFPVYYRISGTASNGLDYTYLNGVATLPASPGFVEIDATPIQDNLVEGDETVIMTLIQTNSYLIEPSAVSATNDILDASTLVAISSGFPNVAYEPNGPPGSPAQAASFALYRYDQSQRGFYPDLTVFYRISGTASNGVDYTLLSGSFTFLAGIQYTNLDINPLADSLVEGTETVTLTLVPTNSYLVDLNFASGTNTIMDSSTMVSVLAGADATEPGQFGLGSGEDGSFDFFRSDSRFQYPEMIVYYQTTGTATNGVDYTNLIGLFTFSAGQITTNILIQPRADNLIEGDESVTLFPIPTTGYYADTNHLAETIVIHDKVTFVPVVNIFKPIGIDYHAPSNSLILSYNYYPSGGGGQPYNFARIYTNLVSTNSAVLTNVVVENWSGLHDLLNEVKVATVKVTGRANLFL